MSKKNNTKVNQPTPQSKNKNTQTFSLAAPNAVRVQLVGEFTQWEQHPISLEKGADGIWQTTIALEPGRHSYRFLVDGEWCDDPVSTLHVPNPFGGRDAVRLIA